MRIFLTLICFAASTSPNPVRLMADETTRDSAVPSKGRQETLQRFVEELVKIDSGIDPFPDAVVLKDRILKAPEAFRISACETTQELYQLITGSNPSRWKGPRNSVESMTLQQAVEFCEQLTTVLRSEKLISPADVVRLPTDIEWEYACRAGSAADFCFGTLQEAATLLDEYAWHTGNAAGNDPAVGVLKPNSWGLYDTHGYLWEFVTVTAPQTDRGQPQPVTAMGGSWRDAAENLTCDSRVQISATTISDGLGFRCVLAQRSPKAKNTARQ